MPVVLDTFEVPDTGPVFIERVKIYTGVLGQIGDIIMFTATARRLKELFPFGEITFAVSRQYEEAGRLVEGLPYIDRLFVAERYFDKLNPKLFQTWERGWPVDLRGDDEVEEQRKHDIILETRPRHRRNPWWEFDHQVAELAHQVGVPGPIDLRTEIAIPIGTECLSETKDRIVLHNDPHIDQTKVWPWHLARQFVRMVGAENVVLLGRAGPKVAGTIDLRGQTTLAEAAAIVQGAKCFVGIDSGLMWIAGSLQVPTVGLYGTSYIPAREAIQPLNPNALYLQAEGTLDSFTPETVIDTLARLRISK